MKTCKTCGKDIGALNFFTRKDFCSEECEDKQNIRTSHHKGEDEGINKIKKALGINI